MLAAMEGGGPREGGEGQVPPTVPHALKTAVKDVLMTQAPVDPEISCVGNSSRIQLSSPIVVNHATLCVGGVVIEWPELHQVLKDEAANAKMGSKMQRRSGGWGGNLYCTHDSCGWCVPIGKKRDSPHSEIKSSLVENGKRMPLSLEHTKTEFAKCSFVWAMAETPEPG